MSIDRRKLTIGGMPIERLQARGIEPVLAEVAALEGKTRHDEHDLRRYEMAAPVLAAEVTRLRAELADARAANEVLINRLAAVKAWVQDTWDACSVSMSMAIFSGKEWHGAHDALYPAAPPRETSDE